MDDDKHTLFKPLYKKKSLRDLCFLSWIISCFVFSLLGRTHDCNLLRQQLQHFSSWAQFYTTGFQTFKITVLLPELHEMIQIKSWTNCIRDSVTPVLCVRLNDEDSLSKDLQFKKTAMLGFCHHSARSAVLQKQTWLLL